jgi:hypothetical protein
MTLLAEVNKDHAAERRRQQKIVDDLSLILAGSPFPCPSPFLFSNPATSLLCT